MDLGNFHAVVERSGPNGINGPPVREVLLFAVIALMPVDRDVTIWSLPDEVGNYHLRIGISAFHIPLAILTLLAIAEFLKRPHRPAGPFAGLCGVAGSWLVVCFLVSSSWRGVDALLHLTAAWAIWDTVRSSDAPGRRRYLIALCAIGAFESTMAVGQRIAGGAVGLDLVEAGGRFGTASGIIAVRGSFIHQYHFVELVLVATAATLVLLNADIRSRVRQVLLIVIAGLGLVVPMTFSRAAVLAIAPMLIVCLWMLRDRLLVPAVVWCTGLITGAMLSLDALSDRASSSVSGTSRSLDSGRRQYANEALDLAGDHPLVGVGPGNYVASLRDMLGLPDTTDLKVLPAHDFVLHYAAEAGIVGGLLALALLVALGVWAVRGGPLRILVVLALVPYFVLDLFPYTWQEGIVISALWLALATIAPSFDHRPDPEDASAVDQDARANS